MHDQGGCLTVTGRRHPGHAGGPTSQIAKIQTPDTSWRRSSTPGWDRVGLPPGYTADVRQTLTRKEYTDLVAFLLTLK
jgi:hypothetical protein